MSSDAKDFLISLLTNLPAIILAGASLVKAVQAMKNIRALEGQVIKLQTKNATLSKELDEVKKENEALRKINAELSAVNDEYRTRLLAGIRRR